MSPTMPEDEPTVAHSTAMADGARPRRPFAPAGEYDVGEIVADRYRIVRRLGLGASAHVWLAHDLRLDRDVALKSLRDTAGQGGAEAERLRREARVLARLEHPRITRVFDLIDDTDPLSGRAPALVTELLIGEDLAARLSRGALGLAETLSLCSQLAAALDAAHSAGIVHRDVKPANVMLTSSGVKLLDFGIAHTAAASDLTGAQAIGTPACMAPEQWLGRRAVPATDVYGLGCLLYWCLAGRSPFADRVLPALAVAHLEFEPPALPKLGQGPEVDALYRACMAKDPEQRPTAGHLTTVLACAALPRQPEIAAAGPAGRRGVSRNARRGTLVGAACLLTAGLIAIPLSTSLPASAAGRTPTAPNPVPSTTFHSSTTAPVSGGELVVQSTVGTTSGSATRTAPHRTEIQTVADTVAATHPASAKKPAPHRASEGCTREHYESCFTFPHRPASTHRLPTGW